MITILTEAGDVSGYGHLNRCLSIQKYLAEGSRLLVDPDHVDTPIECGAESVHWRQDPLRYLRIEGHESNVVLVDSYHVSYNCLAMIRQVAHFLVILDDYNRLTYPADVVVNPSLFGPRYANDGPPVLGGADWILLREGIVNHPKHVVREKLETVAITLGGSGDLVKLESLCNAIASNGYDVLVLPGSQSRADELRKRLRCLNITVLSVLGAREVAGVFATSDLVVSAGGQTLNELAFLGVPFLAIETGKDQRSNLESYQKLGLIESYFRINDGLLVEAVLEAIAKKCSSRRRKLLAELSTNVCDGKGSQRVAELLERYDSFSSELVNEE